MSIHQGMVLVSLLIFAVETLVFVRLKAQVDQTDTRTTSFPDDDDVAEEMFLVLKEVEPEQLLVYTAIYVALLLAAYYIHFILSILIFVQVMSVCSEIWLLKTLKSADQSKQNPSQ